MLTVPALPFPLTPSQPGVWRTDEGGGVVADAPAGTDLYVDPAGADLAGAGSTVPAPTLLGTPPAGDYQLSARVTVEFRTAYDAGVLLLQDDDTTWAKLCFELSPAAEPTVVTVVTRGVSDDANAFALADRSAWLRVSRIGPVHAFHASADGRTWRFVRLFRLGEDVAGLQVGFEAQSPTGEGCTVRYTDVRFEQRTLADQRDGS